MSWPQSLKIVIDCILAMLATAVLAVMINMTVSRKLLGFMVTVVAVSFGMICLSDDLLSVLQTGYWPIVVVLGSTGVVGGLVYVAWYRLAHMDLP